MVAPTIGSPSGSYVAFSSFAPSKGQNAASREKRCLQAGHCFISRRMSSVCLVGGACIGSACVDDVAARVLGHAGVGRGALALRTFEAVLAVLGARAGRVQPRGRAAPPARIAERAE